MVAPMEDGDDMPAATVSASSTAVSSRLRCSDERRRLREPLPGTASVVHRWVCIELPAPWGHKAWRDTRMDADLSAELLRRAEAAGARAMGIRRHGPTTVSPITVLAAVTTLDRSWLERIQVADVADVPDAIDWLGLASGTTAGGDPHEDAIMVCTNGGKDPCCAERGRPVAAALTAAFGDAVWECTHLGGDRFAPNICHLPSGTYMGEVDPVEAPELIADLRAGRLTLARYRGWCALGGPVQTAEIALRHHLDEVRMSALELRDVTHQSDTVAVTFAHTGSAVEARFRVTIKVTTASEPRLVSCRADQLTTPTTHEVLEIATVA